MLPLVVAAAGKSVLKGVSGLINQKANMRTAKQAKDLAESQARYASTGSVGELDFQQFFSTHDITRYEYDKQRGALEMQSADAQRASGLFAVTYGGDSGAHVAPPMVASASPSSGPNPFKDTVGSTSVPSDASPAGAAAGTPSPAAGAGIAGLASNPVLLVGLAVVVFGVLLLRGRK